MNHNLYDHKHVIKITADELPVDIENIDDPAVDEFFDDMHDAIDMAMRAVKTMLSEKYPNFTVEVF